MVDVPDAGDQAVGGRALDQFLLGASLLLRGEDQRAVLDERPLVDEVVEVLSGGPVPPLVALCDRVGPRLVEPDRVALADRSEIFP